MPREHITEKIKGIERTIGWKAKQELIWAIQEKQGKTRCFQTGAKHCDQLECCWRSDCKPGKR